MCTHGFGAPPSLFYVLGLLCEAEPVSLTGSVNRNVVEWPLPPGVVSMLVPTTTVVT